jgi:alkylation response protein AidB-like acyl-CoA dehydrogenase
MLMTQNHEQELLEKTVKRFVEEELYPHEEAVDKNGEQPE